MTKGCEEPQSMVVENDDSRSLPPLRKSTLVLHAPQPLDMAATLASELVSAGNHRHQHHERRALITGLYHERRRRMYEST